MLKRKRKINKAYLIASSRRYRGPLPLAYAELLRRGVGPQLAEAMVRDAATIRGCCDRKLLTVVVIWQRTNYYKEWLATMHPRKVNWQ